MKGLRFKEMFIVGVTLIVIAYGGVCLLSSVTIAQEDPRISAARALGYQKCTGYQTLTPNSSTAVGLTPSSMTANTQVAFGVVETAAFRFFRHGPSPTKTLGVPVSVGSSINLLSRDQILKFKLISQASSGSITFEFCE
jgi:hypothetical protein